MRFQLRPFLSTDVDSVVRYANNPKVANNLTDQFPHPYNENHAVAFIEKATAPELNTILAITIDQEAVGGIGLHPQTDIYRKNAELGYWLGEPFWGQGIMSSAVPEMLAFGFANLDIVRIYARPFGSNLASQRILEKAGFRLEARMDKVLFKNGRFEDELIYAVRKYGG
ncbi:MAG: GNAT family N-acetyltransferase [Saprospiraceae bacterium]